jgi:ParB-like chromosome segregation protein Spo0J
MYGEGFVAAGTENPQLHLIEVEISALKPDPLNPRVHSERQLRTLAKSIRAFGFVSPILIDQEFRVIAGHCRIEAARLLGLKTVPAIPVTHLSDAQRRALMIADNRLAEQASWDNKLLAEHLKILADSELHFEIEATGFEMAEIDLRIEGLSPDLDPECDPADELPETPPAAVTHLNDLWMMGRHRVFCGSCLDAKSYSVLMDGQRAAVAFTDPPYNLAIPGCVSGLGKIQHNNFAM